MFSTSLSRMIVRIDLIIPNRLPFFPRFFFLSSENYAAQPETIDGNADVITMTARSIVSSNQ